MGSALGSALSMTSSTSWNDIVNKIKGVANQGAKTSSLNCGGSYTIPAGYHNGSGKITANSLSSQTDANAAAGQILSGYTAWVKGSKITGTMANKGALNWSGSNTTYSVPAGYYSGGTLNSKTSYTNGYNAGVSAADNRANTNSTNYKTGYNAGYSAATSSLSKAGNGTCNTHTTTSSTVSASSTIKLGILVCYSARDHKNLNNTSVSASSSNCSLSELGNYSVTGNYTSSIMRIYKVTNLSSGKTVTISHVGTSVQFALVKIN